MTAIAIDLWDKRSGIAIEVQWMAIPKEIVLRVDLINILKKYFDEYKKIDTIVVWLPYDLYWKELKQLNKTKEFIREIERKFKDKKVVWIDERFTTFEAENVLNSFWIKDKKWQKDDISASLILESYLNNNK